MADIFILKPLFLAFCFSQSGNIGHASLQFQFRGQHLHEAYILFRQVFWHDFGSNLCPKNILMYMHIVW